jgi:hypothetical protein
MSYVKWYIYYDILNIMVILSATMCGREKKFIPAIGQSGYSYDVSGKMLFYTTERWFFSCIPDARYSPFLWAKEGREYIPKDEYGKYMEMEVLHLHNYSFLYFKDLPVDTKITLCFNEDYVDIMTNQEGELYFNDMKESLHKSDLPFIQFSIVVPQKLLKTPSVCYCAKKDSSPRANKIGDRLIYYPCYKKRPTGYLKFVDKTLKRFVSRWRWKRYIHQWYKASIEEQWKPPNGKKYVEMMKEYEEEWEKEVAVDFLIM